MIPAASDAGSTANTTSESSTTVTVTQDFAVSDRCLVFIACDNAGASGVSAISSVTDPSTNTLTSSRSANRTQGNAANDGVTVHLFQFQVTAARPLVTNDLITVNFSTNVAAKCVGVARVTGIMLGAANIGGSTGTGSSTSATSNAYASGPDRDDILFGLVGSEHTTAPGGDTDTTAGSWSDLFALDAGSGTNATNIRLRAQYKVVTGASSQTFNVAVGSGDWACLIQGYYHRASLPTRSISRSTRALVQAR